MAQNPTSFNSASDDEFGGHEPSESMSASDSVGLEAGEIFADSDVEFSQAERSGSPRQKSTPKSPTRESVRTVDERLKDLGTLPSLQTEPTNVKSERVVDADARPPILAAVVEPKPSQFVDRGAPIPEHYGMDRLVNLPRDPNWVFSYWELRGGALDRLRFAHSAEIIDNSRWVLRVRAVRELTEYFVDVDLRANQWYLKVSPDTRFLIDLGFVDQHGKFTCVLRGNEVATPRPCVSDITDERWAILREDLERLLKAGGADPKIGPSSDSAPRFSRTEQPRAIGFFSGTGMQIKSN